MINRQGERKIEWCDWTWNPIAGCKHNCSYCYLKRLEKRYGNDMMTPRFRPDMLDDISKSRKIKKGDVIFVGSTGDMFGEWNDERSIQMVLDVANNHEDYFFVFLTKNPIRYKEFEFNENCILGTTIEDDGRKSLDRSMDFCRAALPNFKSMVMVSFEPLLGKVDGDFVKAMDWIIIGANSNSGSMKPDLMWVRDILSVADRENIPVFMKFNLKHLNPRKEFPERIIEKRKESVDL